MKITVDNPEILLMPLYYLSSVINSKSVVPELGCILMTAAEDHMTMKGSSGNMSLTLRVKDISVEEEGVCLVNHILLTAALDSLQGKVILRETPKKLIISPEEGGVIKREIFKADPTLLPDEPDITGVPIEVKSETLRDALEHTLFAMNQAGDRPELSVAYIGQYVMCGDGTRLSSYQVDVPEIGSIPSAVITPLLSLLKMGDVATFYTEGRWIGVSVGDSAKLKFNRSSKEFPAGVDYTRSTYAGMEPRTRFVLDVGHARRILQSLQLYSEAAAKHGILYTTLHYDGKSHPQISVSAPNAGVFEDILRCSHVEGPEVTFLFSSSSLLDALGACGENEVELRVWTAEQPVLLWKDSWVVVQGTLSKTDRQTEEPVQKENEEDDF